MAGSLEQFMIYEKKIIQWNPERMIRRGSAE